MTRFRMFIAQSLDGYIARPDGAVDWLRPLDSVDYGYETFLGEIGTVVMGRKSYELARSFGEPSATNTESGRNQSPTPARIYGSAANYIYCTFNDLQDLTLRRYDRFGYASYEASVPASDFTPQGEAKRWTSITIEQGATPASMKPAIRAMAADPLSQDVWAAIGDELVHFDKDGNRRAAYRTSTKDGAPIEAGTILVERNRILVGADPMGIFDFDLPERMAPAAAQQ